MISILKIHNWFYATNTKRKAILDNDLRLHDNKSILFNYVNEVCSAIYCSCMELQIKIHYSEDRKLYQAHWNSSQDWDTYFCLNRASISTMQTKESIKRFILIHLHFRYYKFLKRILQNDNVAIEVPSNSNTIITTASPNEDEEEFGYEEEYEELKDHIKRFYDDDSYFDLIKPNDVNARFYDDEDDYESDYDNYFDIIKPNDNNEVL